ncbi:hypothetical protein AX15_001403 [Amanita polypyramis BW_CC]|nr:hypothetical protein AX15_001403 [Amanita polypyramis BW_CC]
MSSNKRTSIQSKFSLKLRKAKEDFLSRTNTASSDVSDASTVVVTPTDGKKWFKSSKIEICEEDLLDWEDNAWGAPKSDFSWSDMFGGKKD